MNRIESIKGLNKILSAKDNDNTIIPELDRKMFLNDSKTMGIIPKKKYMQEQIEREFDTKMDKPIKIDFMINNTNNSVNLDAEMLGPILEFIKRAKKESVEIFVKKDSPIQFSLEDVDIILAPKMENKNNVFQHIELHNALELLGRALQEKGIKEDKINELKAFVTALMV